MTKLIVSLLVNSLLLRPGGRGVTGVPVNDALLLESGDYLLLESGDKLLLE